MHKKGHLHLFGLIFTLIVGTLLHFTYEWSGKNPFIGIISAINESTWEHLKLLFIPFLFCGIIEYFIYGRKLKNFIPVKVISVFTGFIVIIVFFYTYVAILGDHFLFADIADFIIGVVVTYWLSNRLLLTKKLSSRMFVILGWLGLLSLVCFFVLFTFNPPHIGLFLDPVYGSYGI